MPNRSLHGMGARHMSVSCRGKNGAAARPKKTPGVPGITSRARRFTVSRKRDAFWVMNLDIDPWMRSVNRFLSGVFFRLRKVVEPGERVRERRFDPNRRGFF